MPTIIHELRWADVDPAAHAFDPAPARRIAEEQVARAARQATLDRDSVERSIDRALLGAYGAWAAGWRWAATEPGGGGPVHAWCCADHSILPEEDPSPQPTIDRIVAALQEWRDFLGELAGRFADLRAATAGLAVERAVEHAAAQLLALIVERTGAEDAWYATFSQVLGWYLETAGCDPERIDALALVISGRFESWIAPEPELAAATCAELGQAIAGSEPLAGAPARDALAEWLEVRTSAFAIPFRSFYEAEPVRVDGHQRYIEGPERARDPARATRMAAALAACRESASRDEPLRFELLASWQAIVLGQPSIAFRTTDAFAKAGRERYPIAADTRARFEAALEQARDSVEPAVVRAARVYLDVCFFHPFADGNARAARLALDHVLSRAGLAAHAVEPLFVVSRAADDAQGASQLAVVIDYLTGPRAQAPPMQTS